MGNKSIWKCDTEIQSIRIIYSGIAGTSEISK